MATFTLRDHNIDIQTELENLTVENGWEKKDSDIKITIVAIVNYALNHKDNFPLKEKVTYKGKPFSEKLSEKQYNCIVDGQIKTKIIEWADERLAAINQSDGKVATKPIRMAVAEKLERQVRFILLVFFGRGMKI